MIDQAANKCKHNLHLFAPSPPSIGVKGPSHMPSNAKYSGIMRRSNDVPFWVGAICKVESFSAAEFVNDGPVRFLADIANAKSTGSPTTPRSIACSRFMPTSLSGVRAQEGRERRAASYRKLVARSYPPLTRRVSHDFRQPEARPRLPIELQDREIASAAHQITTFVEVLVLGGNMHRWPDRQTILWTRNSLPS